MKIICVVDRQTDYLYGNVTNTGSVMTLCGRSNEEYCLLCTKNGSARDGWTEITYKLSDVL